LDSRRIEEEEEELALSKTPAEPHEGEGGGSIWEINNCNFRAMSMAVCSKSRVREQSKEDRGRTSLVTLAAVAASE
jgi:hypothetical protein